MQNLTDEEIFLQAIKASGKVAYENRSERQQGIFVGVTIGTVMVRDGLSLKAAKEKAYELRERLYKKWLNGELKSTEVTT